MKEGSRGPARPTYYYQDAQHTDNDLGEYFGNSEIAVNEHGAKQSKLEVRYDLLPPGAVERVAHVFWYGSQRYGIDNWKGIPVEDHINHIVAHVYAFLAGDRKEDHLGHVIARAMMAFHQHENELVPQKEPNV